MSQRCGSGAEHEGSRRMKTELLIQMDGIVKKKENVFILAASTLPWDLDIAMLRRLEKRVVPSLFRFLWICLVWKPEKLWCACTCLLREPKTSTTRRQQKCFKDTQDQISNWSAKRLQWSPWDGFYSNCRRSNWKSNKCVIRKCIWTKKTSHSRRKWRWRTCWQPCRQPSARQVLLRSATRNGFRTSGRSDEFI